MKLSEKILYLRKKQGMTQEQLAEKMEVSRQAVSRWESGTALPDASNIVQLSKIFAVSADYPACKGSSCGSRREREKNCHHLYDGVWVSRQLCNLYFVALHQSDGSTCCLWWKRRNLVRVEQQRYSIQLPVLYRNIQSGISDSTFCGGDGSGNRVICSQLCPSSGYNGA